MISEKNINLLKENEFMVYLKFTKPNGEEFYEAFKIQFDKQEVGNKSKITNKAINKIKEKLPKNYKIELIEKDEYWAEIMGMDFNKYSILN